MKQLSLLVFFIFITLIGFSQSTKNPNGISLFRINKLTINDLMYFCDTSGTEKHITYRAKGAARYGTVYGNSLVEYKIDTLNYGRKDYIGCLDIFHPKVRMFKIYGYRIPNSGSELSGIMDEMELLFYNDTLKEVTFEAFDDFIYNKLTKEYGPGVVRKEVNPSEECYGKTDVAFETIWKNSKYYINSWKKDYYFENCNTPKTYRRFYFAESKYNTRNKNGEFTFSPWYEEGMKYQNDFESKYLKD